MLLMSHSPVSRDEQRTDRDGATPVTDDDGDLGIDAPATSRPDERIAIRIVGAHPGDTVEFSATIRDGDGVKWQSRRTCIADSEGVVELTAQAPESGCSGD